MISRRVEYVIFLIVLIALAVVFSGLTTEIKQNHAPYNKGLSPEQVIEKELQITVNGISSGYRCKIISNSLFAVVDSGEDGGLHVGYKNEVSGFSFYDRSINILSNNNMKRYKKDPNENMIFVEVTHIVDDYAINIKDNSWFFSESWQMVIKDQSGKELEKIETPKGIAYWIMAFENIPDDFKLIAECGNQSTVILDKEEILNFFGGRS